jgi:NitT/TauT family transport system substrate-binding protein
MKRLNVVMMGLVGLLGGTLHCGEDEKANPKLRVGMLHWAGYGAINVADAKGFWKAEGLDVEVINRVSNQELNADLTSGRIDVALDMMGSWVGIHLSGIPLKIIGETDWSYGGDQIIAKKTLDTTKLKGRQVAIYLDQPSVTFFLGKYLEGLPAPLKLSDISTVELETKAIADAFIAGTYELSVNYEPASAEQTTATAQGEVVATSGRPGFEGVIPEGFVGRADIIAKIPKDSLKKLFKGWQSAVKFMYSDPDNRVVDEAHWPEYAEILRTRTFVGDGPYTDQELRTFVSNVKVHSANLQLCVNEAAQGMKLKDSTALRPQPIRDYLTELRTFLEEGGKLPTSPAANFAAEGPDGIFDNSAAIEALREIGATCPR